MRGDTSPGTRAHDAIDTTSNDASPGLDVESSLGVGRFLSRRFAVAAHLAETWTIANTDLIFLPATLNLTASAEAQYWPSDRVCLAAGFGAGRYMTVGDAPRVGPVAHAHVGHTFETTRAGFRSVTLGVFPCFYPGRRAVGFALGAQLQNVRPFSE